jgi:hypothetical protein
MVRVLKRTRSMSSLEDYIKKIPYSLKPAVLSTRFRKSDRERLLRVLNGNIKDIISMKV